MTLMTDDIVADIDEQVWSVSVQCDDPWLLFAIGHRHLPAHRWGFRKPMERSSWKTSLMYLFTSTLLKVFPFGDVWPARDQAASPHTARSPLAPHQPSHLVSWFNLLTSNYFPMSFDPIHHHRCYHHNCHTVISIKILIVRLEKVSKKKLFF